MNDSASRPPAYAVALRPDPARPTYFPQIEGLRGVLAVYVVFAHILPQVWPDVAVSPLSLWGFRHGRFAVDTFIVVSGFVLGAPVARDGGLRRGVAAFYRARFWRIVPTYWAATLVSFGLILTLIGRPTGTHWDHSLPWTWPTLLAVVTLTPDWFGHYKINHVFWSVAVEVKIYLVFPLIVAFWRRIGLPLTTLAVAIFLGGAGLMQRRWLGGPLAIWSNANPWYLVLFLFGAGAATVVTSEAQGWRRLRGLPCGLTAALLMILVASLVAAVGYEARPTLIDLMVGVVAALALVSLVARPGLVASALQSRPMLWVGTFSYSLYLIHAPILQVVHQYVLFSLRLSQPAQFAALATLGLPASLLGAWCFFLAVERRFLPSRRLVAEAHLSPDLATADTGRSGANPG